MNQSEVLAQANRLVSGGLRKAAIDLLHEYLDFDPVSTKVLSALGRAYLLDRQPERAVEYLKRSLEVSQRKKSPSNASTCYQSEEFDDDDMGFVSAEARDADESAFDFESNTREGYGRANVDPVIEVSAPPPSVNPEAAGPALAQGSASDVTDMEVSQEIGGPDSEPQSSDQKEGGAQLETPIEIKDSGLNQEVQAATDERSEPLDTISRDAVEASPASDVSWVVDPESADSPLATKEIEEFDEDIDEGINEFDLDESFEDGGFDDGGDVADDAYEDVFSDALPSFFFVGDEYDDVDLGGLDDLDEFDELSGRVAIEQDAFEGAVTREQRARQIAVDVIVETGWDSSHLSLLQEIFFEKGWSATRRALQLAIKSGMTPEELALARDVRAVWEESDRYWMTFHKIKSCVDIGQTDAAYRNMSWLESLRLIRCFPGTPSIEEVTDFIEESYEQWYGSRRLRNAFEVFLKFLRYRADVMRRTGRGRYALSMIDASLDDPWVDSADLSNSVSPETLTLHSHGVVINPWPHVSENKMKVDKRYADSPAFTDSAEGRTGGQSHPEGYQQGQPKVDTAHFGFRSSMWQ